MNKIAHDIDCKNKETDHLTNGCSKFCDFRKESDAPKESDIEKMLNEQGFNIIIDNEGKMSLSPDKLWLQSIKIRSVKRGRYIADPRFVPNELADKNILWINDPVEVSAVTKSGNEIKIFVEEVTTIFEKIDPDEAQ